MLGAIGAVLLLVACGGSDIESVTAPTVCASIGGTYRGRLTNSCGYTATDVPVVVTQTLCAFTATFPNPGGPVLTGAVSATAVTFTIALTLPCGATAGGTASIDTAAIVGSFAGPASGSACCSPLTGTFSLTR